MWVCGIVTSNARLSLLRRRSHHGAKPDYEGLFTMELKTFAWAFALFATFTASTSATAGVCYSSASYSAVTNSTSLVALSEPIPAGAAYTVAWSSASISSVRVIFDHSATSTFTSVQPDQLNSLNPIPGNSPYTETVSSANNGGSATNAFRFNPDTSAVFSNVVISSATCTGTGSSSSSSGTPATAVPTLPLFGLLALGGLLGLFGLRKLNK